MKKNLIKSVSLSLLFFAGLFSDVYAESVDKILEEYTQKNRLSQKTIDENKGHLYLFTRERLERMHATTLKDVFKSLPVIFYNENRYGLPDPMASGSIEPYRSNFIRLYVDGVEITHGWAGSGLILYGDINIDFVDHIEFYYMSPSLESSVEPAFLTIFLYSKDPKYDSGGKLSLQAGSRGSNTESFSYGGETDDFSYMINISRTDENRIKVDNGTPNPLSKDFERLQLFSYIKTEDQIFHLQVIKKRMDSFAGASWDATPLVSDMEFLNLHMDYGIDLGDYWKAQFSYDRLKIGINAADEIPIVWDFPRTRNLFVNIYGDTFTGELSYQNTIGDHHLHAGVKSREKRLLKIKKDDLDSVTIPFDTEKVFSFFFQDQYAFSEHSLLNLGLSYNIFKRNGGVDDDELLQLRLGYIYANENWSFKTYLYRMQVAMEPLMYYMLPQGLDAKVDAQTTLGVSQEIGYTEGNDRVRLIMQVMRDENSLLQEILKQEKDGVYYVAAMEYEHQFDRDNSFQMHLYDLTAENIYQVGSYTVVGGYFNLLNKYQDFDFYNGLVWNRNDLQKTYYFDWSCAVTWNINQDLTVTLKGDNLLDRAFESRLYRWDMTGLLSGTQQFPTPLEPISASPFDRRIMLELEYLF